MSSDTIQPMTHSEYRQLTLSDVEEAAQVIAQAYVDDPLISYMLPFKSTRIKTTYKFMCAYGEINKKTNAVLALVSHCKGLPFGSSPIRNSCPSALKQWGNFCRSCSRCIPSAFSGQRQSLTESTNYTRNMSKSRTFTWIISQFSHLHAARGCRPNSSVRFWRWQMSEGSLPLPTP